MLDTTDTYSQVFSRCSSSLRLAAALCMALGLMGGLAVTVPQPVQAQNTYTVDVTGDLEDTNPGDGTCATTNGNCSLRAAIEESDADPNNEDTIEFGDIAPGGGPAQITPSSQLTVNETVTIDGTTENSYTGDAPTVLIDGSSLPGGDGLFLETSANGSTIQALAIVDAPDDGIDVASEVTIQDCYVGVSTDGTTANGNGNTGIRLFGNDNFAVGNVIGGNASAGIAISGSNNFVYDNLIGVGSDGTTDVGNGGAGVRVDDTGNFIGACLFGCAGNTISGNDGAGIQINANGQSVVTNFIGTDESGTSAIPNNTGIAIESNNNTIGGSDDQRNVISGNEFTGIRMGNQTAADNNTIENNYIGTDLNGENDLGNGSDGIRIEGGTGNSIEDNVIGNSDGLDGNGNGNMGVEVLSNNNSITGNLIGTNANGDNLENRQAIVVDGADNNTIGGTSSGDGNVMAFSTFTGLSLKSGADGNTVQGNYIGTNASGADLGNGSVGLEIFLSNNNVVGYDYSASDLTTGAANNIAYNGEQGLHVNRDASTGNVIRGNSIYSNTEIGIDLGDDGVTSNDIGDTDTGENNLQNFPEIDQSQTEYNESTGNVEVRYKVDSNPGDATYDIKVDFYIADSESSGEGKTYIGTDTYPEAGAGAFRSVAFAPPSGVTVTRSDYMVATATDANGNTSEFTSTATQLPVELTTFDAQVDGKSVQLTWQTASETNNAGFEVERTKGGTDEWRKVGFVEGHGTTSDPHDYAFTDTDLSYEIDSLSYRLRQVDTDGSATLTDPVAVARGAVEGLQLKKTFPNPTRQRVTVRYAVPEKGGQEVTLRLYDVLGRQVRSVRAPAEPGRHERTLSVGDLGSGVYFLRLRGGDAVQTRRLTVVR